MLSRFLLPGIGWNCQQQKNCNGKLNLSANV